MDEPTKFELNSAEPFERDGQKWWLVSTRAFHTGEYLDKGVNATPEWVKEVVSKTPTYVPLGFEHKDTMFDGKGMARDFTYDEATGSVFCKVEMPDALKSAVELAGVSGVSVELTEAGGISQLDITPRPRIQLAQMFSADSDEADYAQVIEFAAQRGELDRLVSAAQSKRDKENAKKQQEEVVLMEDETQAAEEVVAVEEVAADNVEETFEASAEPQPEVEVKETAQFDASSLIAETERLSAEVAAMKLEKVEFEVSSLIKEGKLPPAMKASAVALLSNDVTQTIQFDDGPKEKSVADLFREFIAGMAPTMLFSADDVSGETEEAIPERMKPLAEAAKAGRRKLGVEE